MSVSSVAIRGLGTFGGLPVCKKIGLMAVNGAEADKGIPGTAEGRVAYVIQNNSGKKRKKC
jgi:hypothetical protein